MRIDNSETNELTTLTGSHIKKLFDFDSNVKPDLN
jgi:hypothetical protein